MNNLLHISGNIFPELGVINHHTKNIWKELSKEFDEYHIIARNQNNKFSHTVDGNIHLHLVPKIINKQRIFFLTSFWMFVLIRRYKITHLLSQSAIIGGFTGVLASKFYRVPILIEIHGDVYFKYMKEMTIADKLFSKIARYTFKNATRIRSLSSSMNVMLSGYGIVEKITIVPNRVNLQLFDSNKKSYSLSDPIKIISIGRFVEQKGYDIAIEAIKDLSMKYNIELSLIGGGGLFDKFSKMAIGFSNIKLIKWIEQKELKLLLENADIYIQPSKPFYGEAMPRTILEAMAMKLPIVSTKIAAIPGILNKENSILINSNSVEELKSSIVILIEDNLLREKIGQKAYQDVSTKYEWNSIFKLYRNTILTMEY